MSILSNEKSFWIPIDWKKKKRMNTHQIIVPGTKRVINQITKPYGCHSPYSNILRFDSETVEYCQSLRTTNKLE